MRHRLVFALAVLALAFAVLVPAAFSQMLGESRLSLPVAPNGPWDQQPSPQPPPTQATEPSEPPPTNTVGPTLPPSTAEPWPTSTPCVPEQPPDTYVLDELAISLERTACFGRCPEYTVTISGTGQVVYEGLRNVRVVGRQEDTIDREKVVALLQGFYSAWFFDLRPEYVMNRSVEVDPDGTVHLREGSVADLPGAIVTFGAGPFSKRVVDYFGAPTALRELEAAIDETAGTDRWVAPPP